MTLKEAKELKQKMLPRRKKVFATLKELKLLLECKKNQDYQPMFNTKLYNKHSGEYCEFLEFLI